MNWLMTGLVVAACGTAYLTWIRPELKKLPSLKEFYGQEESLLEALKLKFAGLKQKAATALFVVAGAVVAAYDQVAPMMLEAGVDMQSLSDKVPSRAWPFILMGAAGLLQWFRHLSDKRAAENAKVLETTAAAAAAER